MDSKLLRNLSKIENNRIRAKNESIMSKNEACKKNDKQKSEAKVMTNGNGTTELKGKLLNLNIFLSTSPNSPKRKRVSLYVETIRNKRNSNTRVNSKDANDYSDEWEANALKLAIKKLTPKFDELDRELDQVYTQILGTKSSILEDDLK